MTWKNNKNINQVAKLDIPLSLFSYKDYNSDFIISWYNIVSKIYKQINYSSTEKQRLNLALSVLIFPYIALIALGIVSYKQAIKKNPKDPTLNEKKAKKLVYNILTLAVVCINVVILTALLIPTTVAPIIFYALNKKLSKDLITVLKISKENGYDDQNVIVYVYDKEIETSNIKFDVKIEFPKLFHRLICNLTKDNNWVKITSDKKGDVTLKLSVGIALKDRLIPLRSEIKKLLEVSLKEFTAPIGKFITLERKDITYNKLKELLNEFRLKVVDNIDSKIISYLIEDAYKVAFIQAIKVGKERRKEELISEDKLKEVLVRQELKDQSEKLPTEKEFIIKELNKLKRNENLSGTVNALSFNYVKSKHKLYLQNKFRKLQKAISLILADLEPFQAKKLQLIFCQDRKIRSEILEFFNFIITLSYNICYISEQDLFENIKDVKIAFGYNSFQVINNNQKKFGAILNIKEYIEASLNSVDLYLQLNCELIISEMIRFVKYKEAITTFQEKYDILKISGDEELRRASGLEEIIENNSLSMEFCKHKINFTIIADSTQELNKNVSSAVSDLSSIGLMTIRNDLHLEDNFWLRLPGNFVFFTQQNSIPIKYSCGFSFIHSFVSGTMKGGRWGEAITTFLSNKDNIYFFNFHSIKNRGHTMVLGLPNSGRTLLINFLLSESRHLNARIILFDNSGKSIIFVKAMNGKYYTVNLKDGLQFNPLKIDNNINNHDMLCGLFKRMVGTTGEGPIDTAVKKIVDYVFSIPAEYRSISKISKILEQLGGNIRKWYGDGEFANIFADCDSESFDWKEKILGINIGKLTKECMHVVLYYFLHRLEMEFDGSPTILLLDEAWKISSIFRTEEEFDDWMNRLKELNVVVIFSTENLSEALISPFSHYVEKHVDTKILMPNPYASKLYKEIFSLSKEEFDMLLQIPAYNRHFLLKQGNRSIVLTLNLSQMREVHVLSANNKTVGFMYDAIQSKGDEANKWLPEFYEKCQI